MAYAMTFAGSLRPDVRSVLGKAQNRFSGNESVTGTGTYQSLAPQRF